MKKITALGLAALTAWGAHAAVQAQTDKQVEQAERAAGADLLQPPPGQAKQVRGPVQRLAAPGAAINAAAPSIDDVGDVASFGRNVRWLGIRQMTVDLAATCPPDPFDGFVCQELAPSGVTTFQFQDVARFTLPAKASKSILCHWFSPILQLSWSNPGATPELGTLTYSPMLTIENPVLDDPTLINPQTGLPFGGSLLTGMTASERIVVPLSPGMAYDEVRRDTATCIAGFISHRGLMESFGLSEAQAREFFKKPTVVRMNIRGSVTHLAEARLAFGLRILGD